MIKTEFDNNLVQKSVMSKKSVIISIGNRRFLIKHLFRKSVIASFLIHLLFLGVYFVLNSSSVSVGGSVVNASDLGKTEFEIDILPELTGGDNSPAQVDKQEWIEGAKNDGADPEEKELNTNRVSGDGTDKDGYLFSFNGDAPPRAIIDFDLRRYYPAEAKSANIRKYQVTVFVQVDESGRLVSSSISTGDAPYGFNEQALKVVRRIRFAPGYKDGRRVKMAHYLPVTFTLD
ncbi:MAG TPA: energy transducer TonB [Spirochaetota bacterium]|nr:energy transducer TonB [Spirochaetota bacterium]